MKSYQVNVPFERARLCLIGSHPLHAQHQRLNLPFPAETLTPIAPDAAPIASSDDPRSRSRRLDRFSGRIEVRLRTRAQFAEGGAYRNRARGEVITMAVRFSENDERMRPKWGWQCGDSQDSRLV